MAKKQSFFSCQHCTLKRLCLPVGLKKGEFSAIDGLITEGNLFSRGKTLFSSGDAFTSLYAIRSGSVKTYRVGSDGGEYVTGFYLPGEIVGLDAFYNKIHPNYAITLETSSICKIPYEKIEDLAKVVPDVTTHMLEIMSQEIILGERILMTIRSQPAKLRIICLLLSFSDRLSRRGYSSTEFVLSMSRADMASYLGLAVETVSRLLKKLQEQNLVEVNHRQIKLLKLDYLKALVEKEVA